MRTILAVPFAVVGIVLFVVAIALALTGYLCFMIGAAIGGE